MRKPILFTLLAIVSMALSLDAQVGDGGYKLVPNWVKLPTGMYFGLKDMPAPPAERDAQAAARRAQQGQRAANAPAAQPQANTGPTNQPGISGLAIDKDDHIYVFN